jgi:hypothetical protein
MTQLELVKEHLEAGRPITAMSALREYGVGRLAPKIHLLRKSGMKIKTEVESARGRHWAKYSLVSEEES